MYICIINLVLCKSNSILYINNQIVLRWMYVSSSGLVIDGVCAVAKAVDFGCKCDITCKSAYVV